MCPGGNSGGGCAKNMGWACGRMRLVYDSRWSYGLCTWACLNIRALSYPMRGIGAVVGAWIDLEVGTGLSLNSESGSELSRIVSCTGEPNF